MEMHGERGKGRSRLLHQNAGRRSCKPNNDTKLDSGPTPSPFAYHMRQRRRPRLLDRLELRFSKSRRVDGLWVGVASFGPEPILHRVEEALRLIQTYDQRRYNRLIRDLERVWVRDIPGAIGNY